MRRPFSRAIASPDAAKPPAPLSADQIARRVIAGFLVGQLLVVALDAAIGGPGPFVLFGL